MPYKAWTVVINGGLTGAVCLLRKSAALAFGIKLCRLTARSLRHNPPFNLPLIHPRFNNASFISGPTMHVLLCEDDDLIASGIVAGLNAHGLTVDRVASAAAVKAMLQVAQFDVMVLDLGLPDEDGLKLLKQLRQQGVELPVLILTARDTVADRVEGLQAGADDYLLKPFDLRELCARLHSLIRRMAGRSVNLIEHGCLAYDPSRRVATLAGQPIELSRREQALLHALLHNRGRVLSCEQLKDCIYGFAEDVESNALSVHIHHLRRKLGSHIVETVRGLGYRLGPAEGAHRQGQPQS